MGSENQQVYLLAKTIVPYIIDPNQDFLVFKEKVESGELTSLKNLNISSRQFPINIYWE